MSRTTLYVERNHEGLRAEKEFSNNHLGAPMIWAYISERYFKRPFSISDDLSYLWQAWKLPQMTDSDTVTLLTTFDNALCEGDRIKTLSHCLYATYSLLPLHSHVGEQAQYLSDLAERESKGITAIGWQQCSATENRWVTYAEGDTEHEEPRPYRPSVDEGHFWIFEDLLSKG